MPGEGQMFAELGGMVSDIGEKRRKEAAAQQKAGLEEDFASRMDKIDPDYGAAIRAGKTSALGSIASIKKQKTEKERYSKSYQEFNLLSGMMKTLNQQQQQYNQQMGEAIQSGDKQKINESKQLFNAMSENAEKMKNLIASKDVLMGADRLENFHNKISEVMSNLGPEKVEMVSAATNGVASKKLNSDINYELENTKELYGVDLNLSGIPAPEDIYRYQHVIEQKGAASAAQIGLINSIDDKDQLYETANDESVPKELRVLAGARAKQLESVDKFMPEIKSQLQGKRSEELVGFPRGGVLGERVSQAATSELESRKVIGRQATRGPGRQAMLKAEKRSIEEAAAAVKDLGRRAERGKLSSTQQEKLDRAKDFLAKRGMSFDSGNIAGR